MNQNRRDFIKAGIAGGITVAASVATAKTVGELTPTPKEIEGPFYPTVMQKDRDFDLTKVEGRDDVAKGTQVFIEGKVVDTSGEVIEDATVDLWQANAAGRYRHPHDPNKAPLDPNFQGWAIVQSGKDGSFRFKTIIPGPYPAGRNWMRPPHIHYKVSKRGYVELVTQMYFEGNPLNEKDLLLRRKAKDLQPLMIAKLTKGEGDKLDTYTFQIVLDKV